MSNCLIVVLVFLVHVHIARVSTSRVILISMDGFRHDYLDMAASKDILLPGFQSIMNSGSRVMRSKGAFPTMTLSAHQTLVTGLHPESHGIVHNAFYDPKFPGQLFDMGDQSTLNDERWFTDIPEPIWVTMERKGYHTASILWPLTDAPFFRKWRPFKQVGPYSLWNSYSHRQRTNDAVNFLRNPEWVIKLVLLYYDEPDVSGHRHGPENDIVMSSLQMLDAEMVYLQQRLEEEGLLNSVDIIITADHGMTELSISDRTIYLNNYVSPNLYDYSSLNPVGMIYPKHPERDLLKLYNNLTGAHPNMRVFLKGFVDRELHYDKHPRIPPLILLADVGWSVLQATTDGHVHLGGHHGYDPNQSNDMDTVFLARGPSFLKNFKMEEIHAVDIYPLMCYLLKLKPNPNNGTLDKVMGILNV